MTMRSLAPGDRAEFVRVREVSRALFGPWMPLTPPGRTEQDLFDLQIEKVVRGGDTGTEYRLVGVLDDGGIAGFFNLFQIARGAFQNCYAGWAVNAEVAGRGYGTEGVGALLDFAFAPAGVGLELHRVQANVIPANAASIRVAEKNGFRREGLAVRYLEIAGRWQDHFMYAKTVEEHLVARVPSPRPLPGGEGKREV